MAKKPLRNVTLVFLIRPGEVLLAMKKRRFGAGKWNGVGGKVEPSETIVEAAAREAKEEIGVEIISPRKVAIFDFYFPDAAQGRAWEQQVHVFLADSWQGEPAESEEMAPQWFKSDRLPFDSMWKDDPYWLPRVLNGEKVRGFFAFDETGESIKDMEVKVW